MVNTAKQTKRDRQRLQAEARAALRRREEQRRKLAIVLGGIAAAALVVLAVVAFMGGGDGDGTASDTATVTAGGPARTSELAPGDAVPAFSAPALSGGGRVSWSDYAGAPAVLSVWAPWCPHCQVELPILDEVMREFPGVGFVTVVTAVDAQPGPTPEEYMADNDLSFPVAVDDDEGSISSALGIQGFPTLYFVSSDGTVAQMATGEVSPETLRDVIGSLG